MRRRSGSITSTVASPMVSLMAATLLRPPLTPAEERRGDLSVLRADDRGEIPWSCAERRSNAATAPTTITHGDSTSVTPSSPSSQRATDSSSVVAEWIGGDGRLPGRGRRRSVRRRSTPVATTPIRITIVPPTLASERQSMSGSSARRWPVTTVKAADTPRWVTGMPPAVGADDRRGDAGDDLERRRRPRRSASASSPPRPNTNGSPPLRRTTRLPCRPSSTSRAEISSCGTALPGRLPTSISSTPSGTRASTPSPTSASWTIDLGLGDQPRRPDGQQVGVTRPGPDEPDRHGRSTRPGHSVSASAAAARPRRRRSVPAAAPAAPPGRATRTSRRTRPPIPKCWTRRAQRSIRTFSADVLARSAVKRSRRGRRSAGTSVERHVGAQQFGEAVAGSRAADVDVVVLLRPPDDAEFGAVRAGRSRSGSRSCSDGAAARRCRCRRAASRARRRRRAAPARPRRAPCCTSAAPSRRWTRLRIGRLVAGERDAVGVQDRSRPRRGRWTPTSSRSWRAVTRSSGTWPSATSCARARRA